uniref:NADH-ubiquinone oxidoreductase chain 2 n=1 Tax=Solea senegalensis TaxID=28829 RepID=Q0KJ15_SOLSE|nr:NADH dehydrogenase subunit 2 [Solea senegalensis]BAF03541.1 NADH dehydrogenase subunit 2 [Solea senegalensis]
MSPLMFSTLLLALGLGSTVTFSSSHWLLAWMGLEINSLAMVPLMARPHFPRAVEAATKYFLAQATAAAMILFAGMTNAWMTGQWTIEMMTHPLPLTLVTLALGLKIGLAPVHAWLPEVLQGVDLTTGLILSTWQKLAPLALLLQLPHGNSPLLIILALSSTLIGGWAGLNQTQLRKILAYSSIAHLGWMMVILQYAPSLTLLALLTYIVMTSSIFLLFKLNNTTNINALATSHTKIPVLTLFAPFILLSLGGLPPLTGFMPKWLILHELTMQGMGTLATITALTALLSLYFYLRLSYSMSLTMSPNNLLTSPLWRLRPHQPTLPLAISATSATMLLPLTPAAFLVR